jgi:hypothetical protein
MADGPISTRDGSAGAWSTQPRRPEILQAVAPGSFKFVRAQESPVHVAVRPAAVGQTSPGPSRAGSATLLLHPGRGSTGLTPASRLPHACGGATRGAGAQQETPRAPPGFMWDCLHDTPAGDGGHSLLGAESNGDEDSLLPFIAHASEDYGGNSSCQHAGETASPAPSQQQTDSHIHNLVHRPHTGRNESPVEMARRISNLRDDLWHSSSSPRSSEHDSAASPLRMARSQPPRTHVPFASGSHLETVGHGIGSAMTTPGHPTPPSSRRGSRTGPVAHPLGRSPLRVEVTWRDGGRPPVPALLGPLHPMANGSLAVHAPTGAGTAAARRASDASVAGVGLAAAKAVLDSARASQHGDRFSKARGSDAVWQGEGGREKPGVAEVLLASATAAASGERRWQRLVTEGPLAALCAALSRAGTQSLEELLEITVKEVALDPDNLAGAAAVLAPYLPSGIHLAAAGSAAGRKAGDGAATLQAHGSSGATLTLAGAPLWWCRITAASAPVNGCWLLVSKAVRGFIAKSAKGGWVPSVVLEALVAATCHCRMLVGQEA